MDWLWIVTVGNTIFFPCKSTRDYSLHLTNLTKSNQWQMLKIHDLLTGLCWYYNWNLHCIRNWNWNWDIMYIMMGRFWFWLRHWLWDRLRLWWRRRARCGLWFRFWVWVIVVVSIAISRSFSPSMSITRSLVIVGIPTVLAAACSSYVNVAQIRGTKTPQYLKAIQWFIFLISHSSN